MAAASASNSVFSSAPKSRSSSGTKKVIKAQLSLDNVEPLNPTVLDDFAEKTLITGCLKLMSEVPVTVYRVADLLSVACIRLGTEWCTKMLHTLASEACEFIKAIQQSILSVDLDQVAKTEQFTSSHAAKQLGVRLHLFCLLLEEKKSFVAVVAEQSGLIKACLNFLPVANEHLGTTTNTNTSKWISPLLLLLDLYEKVCFGEKQRQLVLKHANYTWKFLDSRDNRSVWTNFALATQKQIDTAFRSGQSTVRYTISRRKFMIDFASMIQVSEESGARRPVIMVPQSSEEKSNESKSGDEKDQEEKKSAEASDETDTEPMDHDHSAVACTSTQPGVPPQLSTALTFEDKEIVVRFCVSLIDVPADADTLHAALRLCLRLTREHKIAEYFAEIGGLQKLLRLKQKNGFTGFPTIATLLLRHIVEDSNTLIHTIDKVIRAAASGTVSIPGLAGVSRPVNELHYVFRLLGPVAARNQEVFTEVAKRILRIRVPPPKKSDDDEANLTGPNVPIELRSLPTHHSAQPQPNNLLADVLVLLLNALTADYTKPSTSSGTNALGESAENRPSMENGPILQNHVEAAPSVDESRQADAANRPEQPLVQKSAVLKLLAELVRSYSSVAGFITQYQFSAEICDAVEENCSPLSFILDRLLSQSQTAGDSDCPGMSRLLIATIAASNHCPEAQSVLVTEIKMALQRACALSESQEKHSRICALVSLVTTMKDSCPGPAPGTGSVQNTGAGQPPNNNLNNIVRLFIKKKLIQDLSRISHCISLSSPHAVNTINTVLKPLEDLTRIINSPASTGGGGVSSTSGGAPRGRVFYRGPMRRSRTDAAFSMAMASGERNRPTAEVSITVQQIPAVSATGPSEAGQAAGQDSSAGNSALNLTPAATIGTEDEQENNVIMTTSQDTFEAQPSTEQPIDETFVIAEGGGAMDDDDAQDMTSHSRRSFDQQIAQVFEHIDDVEEEDSEESDEDEREEGSRGHVTHDHVMAEESQDEREPIGNHRVHMGIAESQEFGHTSDESASEHSEETVGEEESDDEEAEEDAEGGNEAGSEYDEVDDDEHDAEDDDDYEEFEGDDFLDQPISSSDAAFETLSNALQRMTNELGPGIEFGRHGTDLTITADSRSLFGLGDGGPGYYEEILNGSGVSGLASTHPLLVRHADSPAVRGQGAGAGAAGAGSILGFNLGYGGGAGRSNLAQRLYFTSGGVPHSHRLGLVRQNAVRRRGPPAGPADGGAAGFLQFIHPTGAGGGRGAAQSGLARLLGANAHFINLGRLGGHGQHQHAIIFGDEPTGRGGGTLFDSWEDAVPDRIGSLSSVPSALSRWHEESRILDGEVVHDLTVVLKPEILEELEKHREKEFEERREKRKQMAEEERIEKEKQEKEKEKRTAAEKDKEQTTTTTERSTVQSEQSDSTDGLSADLEVIVRTTEASEVAAQQGLATTTPPSETGVTSATNSCEIAPTQRPAESLASLAVDVSQNLRTTSATSGDANVTVVCVPSPVLVATTVTPTSAESVPDSVAMQVDVEQDANSNITCGSLATNPSTDSANEPVSSSSDTSPSDTSADRSTATSVATTAESGTTSSANLATSEDYRSILGDIVIPEGVDPAFLAALPEDLRQEVLDDARRRQGLAQVAANPSQLLATIAGGSSRTAAETPATVAEVPPAEVAVEFLAALPPELQEEILAQQRQVQAAQRAQAADQNASPVAWIENLSPSLRQQVLAEMDDTEIAALPEALASEARRLRLQMESQLAQRYAHAALRQFPFAFLGGGGREGARHVAMRSVQRARRGQGFDHEPFSWAGGRGRGEGTSAAGAAASKHVSKGQPLLDREALSSLLILFFIDDPKLNIVRLQRILKCLCCHAPTRDWIIRALLSILEKTRTSLTAVTTTDTKPSSASGSAVEFTSEAEDKASASGSEDFLLETKPPSQSWLNLAIDEALGQRSNVFRIDRTGFAATGSTTGSLQQPVVRKGSHGSQSTSAASIQIHEQAAASVCKHVLDALIPLAKSFPEYFTPSNGNAPSSESKQQQPIETTGGLKASATPAGATPKLQISEIQQTQVQQVSAISSDFWDIILRLDAATSAAAGGGSKKGKGLARPSHSTSSGPLTEETHYASITEAPVGHLMAMLSHPLIARSNSLMDRLLRLLSSVSTHLNSTENGTKETKEKGTATTTTISTEGSTAMSADKTGALENQIQLVVEVLSKGLCSDDGLEDVRTLLLHLVRVLGTETQKTIFQILLRSAQQVGEHLADEIQLLLKELCNLATSRRSGVEDGEPTPATSIATQKGQIVDRFAPGEMVIIGGPGVYGSRPSASSKELQLPSMVAFTQKNSTQNILYRTIHTIIQLREAVQHRQRALALRTAVPQRETSERTESVGADTVDTSQTPMEVEHGESKPEATQLATSQMEVDQGSPPVPNVISGSLSELLQLDSLWEILSNCLEELGEAPDTHAVLVLQSAVETFFLVHSGDRKTATERELPSQQNSVNTAADRDRAESISDIIAPVSPAPLNQSMSGSMFQQESSQNLSISTVQVPPDTQKFLKFAEQHRKVLNHILRQSQQHLADGPFSVLVDHTRLLDFDIKRKYFRRELERSDDNIRRDDIAIRVRRDSVFQDSYRELHRIRVNDWKGRFYIVFEGEEGQDAGGLLREWFMIITREIFNPHYALFQTSPGDRVTYMINPSSYINREHLDYFKFVGRIIAKAAYDNKLLECYFTRAFYKHILGKAVRHTDMESEDPSFYQSLVYLLENPVESLGYELTFSLEVEEFGVREIRDLKQNGRNISVTDDNKAEYVRLVCQMKMTGAIRQQLNAFLGGFYDIIPKRLIGIFNEQELELLISGLPTIDIDDLRANTEYHKYTKDSLQIQWFWRALRSFDQADRAKFLQFVTGTSKVPLQGFGSLEGMNGVQKFQIHRDDRSTGRLPAAHTCFNQLDLPAYETYDKLRHMLLLAVHECSEGFGFA